jgi:hypothetical protein
MAFENFHTGRFISTPRNLFEAGFSQHLRRTITSSEEQSSSRRERKRSPSATRQRETEGQRRSFCSRRGPGESEGAAGASWQWPRKARIGEVAIWKSNQSFKKSDPWGDVSQEASPLRFARALPPSTARTRAHSRGQAQMHSSRCFDPVWRRGRARPRSRARLA